mgnify:CR=1 FL=1
MKRQNQNLNRHERRRTTRRMVTCALLCALAGLRRFYPQPFELIAITVDMGFGAIEANQGKELPADPYADIRALCERLEVPYHVVPSEIARIIFDVRKEQNPCSLCAKLRRGALNNAAKELGCNKIALGHHFSDVIETTLIGMFYSSQMSAMLPKLHSKNYEGMELIRPLYCVHEDDILSWVRYNGLSFLQCACRFTENTESGVSDSKRKEVKELIRTLRKDNPDIEISIFNSLHSVEINTFPGYKLEGKEHSFLEHYTDTD